MIYAERKSQLLGQSVEQLAASVLDDEYNRFLGDYANFNDSESPIDPTIANGIAHGKRLPYIGWWWRHTDWFAGRLTIGDCGDFIGQMENNKWGYPQRRLTAEEFAQVLAIVDNARRINGQGGVLSEIAHNTKAELEKLWPLFQTFRVER